MVSKINVSLSDLLKKSAKAICYFRKRREQFPVTPRMVEGNEQAQLKSTSEFLEMRGTYEMKKILIHYTFDEIEIDESGDLVLVEHKNITEGSIIEPWYFESSILQTAVYRAFLERNPKKEYFTAKFFRRQGYKTKYLDVTKFGERVSILYMGNIKYAVELIHSKPLVEFYKRKANATREYESAIDWDEEWKFKEFAHLEQYIDWDELIRV